MPIYSNEINKIAAKPAHARNPAIADAHAAAASFECGSFVRFELAETEAKIDLAYRTNGCGFLVAAADVIAEHLNGRLLSDLHGLADAELAAVVESCVGENYPRDRQHCLAVVLEGVHAVFANLRESRLAQHASSKATICTCFSVSEDTIENCIAQNALTSVAEVTALCRAGGGCGSCRMLIREMLDAHPMI